MGWLIAIIVLMFILLLPTMAVGAMFIFFILKPKDKFTNRVSHLRLLWLALAYPSRFDDLYYVDENGEYKEKFEWLIQDVNENFK